MPGAERLVELGLETIAVTVHDSPFQASRDGPAGAILDRGVCRCAFALERGDESRERVIALAAPVVYEIKADVAVGLGYLVQGLDLSGMDDRGIEPGLNALVQEDRVEHLAGSGGEPEGDIR